MKQADAQGLKQLLASINSGEEAIQELLSKVARDAGLYPPEDPSDPGASFRDADSKEDDDDGSPPPPRDMRHLAKTGVIIDEPETEAERGQVWRVGPHYLVVADLVTDWPLWVGILETAHTKERPALFVPYPGPYTALSQRSLEATFVMVQPDPYISGHILDRYVEINGQEGVFVAR